MYTYKICFLGNHALPKGTNVFICPYVTHRLDHIFPNPKKFDPERFSSENLSNLHSYAFLPFSGGPRNCIGMHAHIQYW